MPIITATVVQRTEVEGKSIKRVKRKANTEGKVGRDMHGTTQVYQLLMCNTMAHHACSVAIPAH